MEITYYLIIFFILGIIMGSFYNVVAYRLPNNMSLIKPGSHCPKCQHKLSVFELIPILSYAIQGGKCRHCHTPISFIYPLVEFSTGILFALSYYIFGMSMELFVSLTFVSTLLIAVVSDLKYMIIPDELLLFSGLLLIMERLYVSTPILNLLGDIFIPFMVLLLLKWLGDFLFKKESLGGGDIKLIALFGIVIGFELATFVIFFAAFIALPISLLVLKIKKTNIIPFGPFLSLAALIIYFSNMDVSWIFNLILD